MARPLPDDWDLFFDTIEELKFQYPEVRTGQLYFNALEVVYPDIAGQIWGTEFDPFKHDDRIPAFLDRAYDLWKESAK